MKFCSVFMKLYSLFVKLFTGEENGRADGGGWGSEIPQGYYWETFDVVADK